MQTNRPLLTRRTWIGQAGATALALSPLFAARAADAWPAKPLRLVVPFAPGGSSEIVARAIAGEMAKSIGQNVFVDNKPGAAGNIAMQEVANSTDGHTLILGHIGTLAVNPYIFAKLPYDAERDFAPITLISKVPSLYVVHPDLPVKDLKEFVAYAKAKPGQLNYGSAGNGSAGHLAMEYLKSTAGTFMLHVPYRGTGPMLTDLMAGRLQAASVGAPALLQFIKAGKLRCIATGSTARLAQLPDVPTVAEQGYKGFEMTQWYGLMAPSKLPREHLDKLEAEAIKATRSKAVGDTEPGDRACRRQHARRIRGLHPPGAGPLETGDRPCADQAGRRLTAGALTRPPVLRRVGDHEPPASVLPEASCRSALMVRGATRAHIGDMRKPCPRPPEISK